MGDSIWVFFIPVWLDWLDSDMTSLRMEMFGISSKAMLILVIYLAHLNHSYGILLADCDRESNLFLSKRFLYCFNSLILSYTLI